MTEYSTIYFFNFKFDGRPAPSRRSVCRSPPGQLDPTNLTRSRSSSNSGNNKTPSTRIRVSMMQGIRSGGRIRIWEALQIPLRILLVASIASSIGFGTEEEALPHPDNNMLLSAGTGQEEKVPSLSWNLSAIFGPVRYEIELCTLKLWNRYTSNSATRIPAWPRELIRPLGSTTCISTSRQRQPSTSGRSSSTTPTS